MKKFIVNLELDIKRNPEYQLIKNLYKRSLQQIKADTYNIFSCGRIAERYYSVLHDAECTKKNEEYIKDLSELEFEQHQRMHNEMLKLKEENLAMRKALQENGIGVIITPLKYCKKNDEVAI